MRMRCVLILMMLSVATLGFARQTGSDIPVTTYLADVDATNTVYYVQSDGSGPYRNALNSVTSILVANGYNGIVDGDWRLDLSSSTSRTARISFEQANAVQPGDPAYQAPADTVLGDGVSGGPHGKQVHPGQP